MVDNAADVIRAILEDPTDLSSVSRLVAPDAVYVSLNFDNPELKQIMPWCGTGCGPEAIVDTYARVGRYWTNESFHIEHVISDGGKVALFGRFTYRSNTVGRAITSPFAIFAAVEDGRVTFMQFMEDTYGTASTFRAGGAAVFRADPDGGEVVM